MSGLAYPGKLMKSGVFRSVQPRLFTSVHGFCGHPVVGEVPQQLPYHAIHSDNRRRTAFI